MQPFNKYYPPDWTPDKGSVNTFVGKHPLGDRARKIDKGILIVRFELPFNIWCTGCDNHIGQGVRYNAEKKKIGNYYSTPILQFRMKCHLCDNWIEIHTDPKNSAYVVVDGARKKVEEWKEEDTEVIKLQDEKTKEQLENDPMYRLEHGIADKKISQDATPHITQLQKLNNSQWSDPYARSKQLRRKFREEKKRDKATQEENNKIKDKLSLAIDLVPEIAKDTIQAQSIEYSASSDELHNRALERVVAPLFNNTSKASNASDLRNMATVRTRLKTDPFYNPDGFKLKKKEDKSSSSAAAVQNKDLLALKPAIKKQKASQSTDGKEEVVTTGLVAYPDSDSDASE